MRKWLPKLAIGIVCIIAMVIIIYIINKPAKSNENGTFEFIVKDSLNTVVIDDFIDFKKGDNAWDIIQDKYDISYDTTPWGFTITRIETLALSEGNWYFALYVNDDYANTNIDGVVLKDGMKICFIEESW